MWYQGLLGHSPWLIAAFLVVCCHATLVSVTVYLHRYSAHRSLDLHPALQHLFRFWLWFTTGMQTQAWTAIHRKHHAHCETADDPHSPVVLGMGEVLRRGAELYQQADTPETRAQFGKGTPDDWLERNIYSGHDRVGIILLLALNVTLFGALGLTVWALQMLCIPVLAAGVINGLGHGLGYRNYEIPSAATNIVPWGIVIAGEELHNNHHTFPNSAKLSMKRWEFDIGWMWIRLFEGLGLATVKSRGPVVRRIKGKDKLDLDTAWAAVSDRFNIMARYADRVVKPLVEQERQRVDAAQQRMLKRMRRLMVRDRALVEESRLEEMQRVLAEHPRLQAIYEMRLQLAEIWQQRSRSREAMLEALRDWCNRAEQSGIDALRDFAAYIRSYSLAPAPAR